MDGRYEFKVNDFKLPTLLYAVPIIRIRKCFINAFYVLDKILNGYNSNIYILKRLNYLFLIVSSKEGKE